MSSRYKMVIMIITLIWMLSMVSCLTFTPDRGTRDQSGQEAVTTDTGPDEFIKVKENVKREKVLLSNKIRCVAADGNNVWVATDRGVSRFSRKDEAWFHYDDSAGLVSDDALAVALDGNLVWFATSHGVSQYDNSSDKWETYTKKDGLAHNSVLSIALDRDLVWFGTSRCLSRYNKITDVWTTFTQFYGPEDI